MFLFGFITDAVVPVIIKLFVKRSEIFSLKGIGNLIFILLIKDFFIQPLLIIFSPTYWYS